MMEVNFIMNIIIVKIKGSNRNVVKIEAVQLDGCEAKWVSTVNKR